MSEHARVGPTTPKPIEPKLLRSITPKQVIADRRHLHLGHHEPQVLQGAAPPAPPLPTKPAALLFHSRKTKSIDR